MSSGMWFHTTTDARIANLRQRQAEVEHFADQGRDAGGPTASFCFDDEWHAMLFLLTEPAVASSVPAGTGTCDTAMCFAGEPLQEAPRDGCCAMTSAEAMHAAASLQALGTQGFRERVGSSAFRKAKDIYYGGHWTNPSQADALAAVFLRFERFYFGAAKRDEGVIFFWV